MPADRSDEFAFFREMCSLFGQSATVEQTAMQLATFAHRLCRCRTTVVFLGQPGAFACRGRLGEETPLFGEGQDLLDEAWRAGQECQGVLFAAEPSSCAYPLPEQGVLYLGQPQFLERPVLETVTRYGARFLAEAASRQQTLTALEHHRQRHDELKEWTDVLSRLVQGLTRELSSEALRASLGDRLTALFPHHHSALLAVGSEIHWIRGSGASDGSAPLVELCRKSSQGVRLDDLQETRLQPLSPGERSLLGYPIQPEGALLVGSLLPEAFQHNDWMALSLLANHVGAAWEVSQLHEEVVLAYQRLQESESQLVHSAKLAAVGQLAAGVAHELNNPMGSIQLALDLCRRQKVSNNPAVLKVLDTASRACERARTIVKKLLYFSRDAHKGEQAMDLNEAVRESADLFRLQLDQDGVQLDAQLCEQPLPMQGNLGDLVQVVGNLLLNARDAVCSVPGGERRVQVRTSLQAGQALLEVEDSGPGVSPAHRDRIFDPFYTTKPVGEGTGLGLSISRQIVERHGGQLELPAPSTFRVRLPLR